MAGPIKRSNDMLGHIVKRVGCKKGRQVAGFMGAWGLVEAQARARADPGGVRGVVEGVPRHGVPGAGAVPGVLPRGGHAVPAERHGVEQGRARRPGWPGRGRTDVGRWS